MLSIAEKWQTALAPVFCETCDWTFLVVDGFIGRKCPHCYQSDLTELVDDDAEQRIIPAPELVVPFKLSKGKSEEALTEFAGSFYFAPKDLSAENLKSRLTRMYLPMWLVDGQVTTFWQGEVGYNYEVVSHNEKYKNGEWHTFEKKETRVRWEPRAGTLLRHYDNVRAPALEAHDELVNPLGKFKLWETEPYEPAAITQAYVRLPDRGSADSWLEAEPAFMQSVEKDCATAADGQHIRQFKWHPTFDNQHWTQMLLPVYSTYYHDEDGNVIPLIVHGRSGTMYGKRIASASKARQQSISLGILAVVVFLVALFLIFSGAQAFVGLSVIAAVVLGAGAILSPIYVSRFNADQTDVPYPKL